MNNTAILHFYVHLTASGIVYGVLLWIAYQVMQQRQNFPNRSTINGRASVINKRTIILTRRPPVDTTVPSGTERHHWLIGIPGIPSDLRLMPEQSHYLSGALLVGDYRQSIESPICVPTFNSTEIALRFTIYDYILILRQ